MAIIKEQFDYPSTNGKDTIVTQLWFDNEVSSRCVLQIVHGMCEYIDRYDHFARFMAKHGFIVCGNDLPGHGKSKGKDGYGYLADNNGDAVLVDDVRALNRTLADRYPVLPLILMGHSMGTFIVSNYITKYGHEPAGIILSGVADTNPMRAVGAVLAAVIGFFFGKRHPSKMLMDIAFKDYNSRYPDQRTKYDWISRDNEVVDKYAADEACTFLFTAGGFGDLARLLKTIEGDAWAAKVPKEKPYFMMSGSMDPVGNFSVGTTNVYNRLKKAGVEDITFKLYEGGRHENVNEINRQEVYEDVLLWAESVLSR